MERRHYRNPPVEEAVCEFHFAPSQEWDFALHIQFLARFRDEYAGKVHRHQPQEAEFELKQTTPLQSESILTMKLGQARLQYATADGTRIVAVGQNILSVHVLRPYEGWEAFLERVKRALAVYTEVARPTGVKRVVIRYINRVQLPVDRFQLDDYFTAPPGPPATIDATVRSVLSRLELMYNDAPVRLALTFGTLPSPPGTSFFLLDIEVSQDWQEESLLPLDELVGVAQNLKKRQSAAFEALITEKTREVFDAEAS